MGHPWLSPGKESSPSPSIKILPRHPDTTILAAISAVGYNPCEICESLLDSIFNEAMAIYLLLRQQACQGVSTLSTLSPPKYPYILPYLQLVLPLRSPQKENIQCTGPSSHFFLVL
jgi:hypothetical protein